MTPYYDEDGITIYCGDCRDVLPLLSAASVQMVFMDPPYGHGNHDGDLNDALNKHRGIESRPIVFDSPNEFREVLSDTLGLLAGVVETDCCCCCCCCGGGGGPRPTFAWVANALDSQGWQFFHSVIWDKVNPGLGWRYRRQHEMVMVAHRSRGKLRWANGDVAVPNVMSMPAPRHRRHPNEKPEALVSRFLSLHAVGGDVVLDPFMGSGTTLVAAKRLGRRAIGIEINEDYCKIAVERLRQGSLLSA